MILFKRMQSCYIFYEYIYLCVNSYNTLRAHVSWYQWLLAAENRGGDRTALRAQDRKRSWLCP